MRGGMRAVLLCAAAVGLLIALVITGVGAVLAEALK